MAFNQIIGTADSLYAGRGGKTKTVLPGEKVTGLKQPMAQKKRKVKRDVA